MAYILTASAILDLRAQEEAAAAAKTVADAIEYINVRLRKEYHTGETLNISVKQILMALGISVYFSDQTLHAIETALIRSGWKVSARHASRSPNRITVFEIRDRYK